MKKFRSLIVTLSLPCLATQALAVPAAPEVTITTSGLSVSILWNEIPDADGYLFHYAPYPLTDPDTIGTIDAGTLTEAHFYLWEGAAFYIAVQSYNTTGTYVGGQITAGRG